MPAKGHSKSKFRGIMCIDLIEMFENGDTTEDFCAKHDISEQTFSLWLDTYPTFRDAYLVAMPKAKAYYNRIMKDNLIEEYKGNRLNMRALELIYRTRFEMPNSRLIRLQGFNKKTSQEKLQSICEAVEKGHLTADEAQKLASLIDSTIKAAEHDELRKRVEEIEQASKIGVDNDDFEEMKE